METSVQQPMRRGTFTPLIKEEYRKDYKLDILPHQKKGIFSRLLWTAKPSIVRIVPGYDAETGEVFRQNININEYSQEAQATDYLSDTFYMASVISRFGNSGSDVISDLPPDSEDRRKYPSILAEFARTVIQSTIAVGKGKKPALKPIDAWFQWAGKNGCLNYTRPTLLMQCLVWEVNGYDMTKETDGLPLFAVIGVDHTASRNALCRALVEPQDPGKPLDAVTNNKYGGLAELNGNILYLNNGVTEDGKYKMLRPSVCPVGQGWKPSPYELTAEDVKSLWVPWKSILNFLTAQEQLKLVANEFGADSVNYVIGQDPRFSALPFPEEIKAVGLGRYAGLVSGSYSRPESKDVQVSVTARRQGLPAVNVHRAADTASAAAARPAPGKLGRLKHLPDNFEEELEGIRKATGKSEQASLADQVLQGAGDDIEGIDDIDLEDEALN